MVARDAASVAIITDAVSVGVVGNAVAVRVRLAGIAQAVTVGVLLLEIELCRAIVACVANGISVCVILARIADLGAVVLTGPDSAAYAGICSTTLSHSIAVNVSITIVSDPVTVHVFLIRVVIY